MRSSRFARFLTGGALNTAVTYGLFVVLSRWLPPAVAYSAVFLLGIALSYVVNSVFVFRVRASAGSAVRFPAVYLAQYATGLALLTLLTRIGVDGRAALPLTMCVTVPLTFAMTRHVLVKAASREQPAKEDAGSLSRV
ncbi:GtrA family protein [Microbispora cellulosiformans]|uniref:GtrA family protein n=1 Tax=Microbispora cellulosiformans TaxID=2614688 RepID=A0A5J5JZY0_9ACTN|nr:GtrA family protein [Microbispora cellulosiformans]KAA9377526.1 GtrA family protein [Microbispora cellulosiformans]